MASQLEQVLVELREMILNGDLKPGERLAEIPLAERLQVSRTPIRHALTLLESEGLLAIAGARGYEIRRFSLSEILDAIEIRGVLEGVAARLVAQHGVTRQLQAKLQDCITEGDEIVKRRTLDAQALANFASMNTRLHGAIVEEAGNLALSRALSLNDKLPFAAAKSVAWEAQSEDEWLRMVLRAHMEHERIVEALMASDSARVEFLMREHAYVAKASVRVLAALQKNATVNPITMPLAMA